MTALGAAARADAITSGCELLRSPRAMARASAAASDSSLDSVLSRSGRRAALPSSRLDANGGGIGEAAAGEADELSLSPGSVSASSIEEDSAG